jgi:hypothetical protein
VIGVLLTPTRELRVRDLAAYRDRVGIALGVRGRLEDLTLQVAEVDTVASTRGQIAGHPHRGHRQWPRRRWRVLHIGK